jgi:hypothetical protein
LRRSQHAADSLRQQRDEAREEAATARQSSLTAPGGSGAGGQTLIGR